MKRQKAALLAEGQTRGRADEDRSAERLFRDREYCSYRNPSEGRHIFRHKSVK
jgi:hypothetical protein